MFNVKGFDAKLAAEKEAIAPDIDTWLPQVDARWSQFLTLRADDAEKRLAPHVNDPRAAIYVQNQQHGITVLRDQARQFLAGTMRCADPVTAEATMRLYERAAGANLTVTG